MNYLRYELYESTGQEICGSSLLVVMVSVFFPFEVFALCEHAVSLENQFPLFAYPPCFGSID